MATWLCLKSADINVVFPVLLLSSFIILSWFHELDVIDFTENHCARV